MTVFIEERYLVKPENQEEFKRLWHRFLEYKKENTELFKEMKSFALFTQTFGGMSGTYSWLAEFDSLADYEKFNMRAMKEEGFMKIRQGFMLLLEATTYSMSAWKPFK